MIASAYNYVADVDADAKQQLILRRRLSAGGLDRALDFDSAVHRINDAGELGQDTVPGSARDATAMALDH